MGKQVAKSFPVMEFSFKQGIQQKIQINSHIQEENDSSLESKGKVKTLSNIPRVAMTAAKIIMPTGCTRNFPIGYW